MPPKVKFTQEEIVNAALRVARRKGANAVTTRDIAAELGVSTRPIFTYFHTMEEVRREIRKFLPGVKIIENITGCTIGSHCGPSTLGIGILRRI